MIAVAATAALAQEPLPSDTPASYRAECGSCHPAFPPGLLSRAAWREIMETLEKHFGDNAAVSPSHHRELDDFLQRNAGETRRFSSRSEPPRLSSTTWFRRTHGAVRAQFRDARVGSAANCGACHPAADTGSYRSLSPLARELARR